MNIRPRLVIFYILLAVKSNEKIQTKQCSRMFLIAFSNSVSDCRADDDTEMTVHRHTHSHRLYRCVFLVDYMCSTMLWKALPLENQQPWRYDATNSVARELIPAATGGVMYVWGYSIQLIKKTKQLKCIQLSACWLRGSLWMLHWHKLRGGKKKNLLQCESSFVVSLGTERGLQSLSWVLAGSEWHWPIKRRQGRRRWASHTASLNYRQELFQSPQWRT